MNKPRKHAELIKAYADGAEIEYQLTDGSWHWCSNPSFHDDFAYRIKREPKPDFFRYVFADSDAAGYFHKDKWPTDNLKLTFDGETGKLKAAEVLK